MVEEDLTDGRRIAQLLSSEVSGRTDGVLGALSVVDADPDVTPTPDGAHAFSIAIDGTADGTEESGPDATVEQLPEHVADVSITPNAAILDVTVGIDAVPDAVPARDDLVCTEAGHGLRIERGAAVKPAVDVLQVAVSDAFATPDGT